MGRVQMHDLYVSVAQHMVAHSERWRARYIHPGIDILVWDPPNATHVLLNVGEDSLGELASCSKLRVLQLRSMDSITALPPLQRWQLLRCVDIRQCDNLSSLEPLSAATQLRYLIVHRCPNITAMPSATLPYLKLLMLGGCKAPLTLPSSLPALTHLSLSGCRGGVQLPTSAPALADIVITWSFGTVSALPQPLTQLTRLVLEADCRGLTSLPAELPALAHASFAGCVDLTALPACLPCLTDLSVGSCAELSVLPTSAAALTRLSIEHCHRLVGIPAEFTALHDLSLARCRQLAALAPQPSLTHLDIEQCPKLVDLPHFPVLQKRRVAPCLPTGKMHGSAVDGYDASNHWMASQCSDLVHLRPALRSFTTQE
jgi:hypothetical protein